MPLVSAGPFSDPYHSALTGIPRADVVRRLGTGMAYSLTNKGVNCPKGGSPCIWSQSTSVTVTNAISFAISRGNTVTYTKTNATNWNDGSTDSTTDILSKATEDSVTRTFASTNSSSFSKNLQDTFTKSLDITRGNTTANSNEQSWTNQLTWNREDSKTQTISNGYEYTALGGNQYNLNVGASRDSVSQKSADNSMTVTCTKTRGWDEGVNLEISKGAASAGYTATISDQNARSVTFTISQGAMKSKSVRNDCSQSVTENNGENYAVRHNCDNTHTVAYSHGGSKAYTHGHTNTFTDELRQTDSTSNAYMSGNTTENGWAITNTDAYGYTTSNTYGTKCPQIQDVQQRKRLYRCIC
ncbi:hypothetical protein BC829DRAFT_225560 [Chytridium lagenaria]|nr:hypothetical protein BC829DRAFT_225560 [Chytridium lagenaria]